jgi:hypothetical protein
VIQRASSEARKATTAATSREDAVAVDGADLLPVIDGQLVQRQLGAGDARVVEHHVDAAVVIHRVLDRPLDRRGVISRTQGPMWVVHKRTVLLARSLVRRGDARRKPRGCGTVMGRAVFDKSRNNLASSARRVVIEAAFSV